MIEKLSKIIKGITQKDIDNNINVNIVSTFGGMICETNNTLK
jgi:hypothetical protein